MANKVHSRAQLENRVVVNPSKAGFVNGPLEARRPLVTVIGSRVTFHTPSHRTTSPVSLAPHPCLDFGVRPNFASRLRE